MEIRLQTESTVLLKNNDNLLPLKEGTKVYVDGANKDTVAMDKEAFAAYFTVVEDPAEADVVIGHVSASNDAAELIVDDAADAEKPLVLLFDGAVSTEPSAYLVEGSDALLFMTFNCTPDHGSSMGNFYHYTLPSVIADMLAGVKAPTGKTVYEMAWTAEDAELDWGELQFDTGVTNEMRLYMAALARNNPTIQMPDNFVDVMYPVNFGMTYGSNGDIVCDTLIVPKNFITYEEETSSGTRSVTAAREIIKAGEPFKVSFIAQNNGTEAGIVNAVVTDNGEPVAQKMVSLNAGQFRVISIEVTLEAGSHTLEVLGMTKTIEVQ
jgi:hypothetical protein